MKWKIIFILVLIYNISINNIYYLTQKIYNEGGNFLLLNSSKTLPTTIITANPKVLLIDNFFSNYDINLILSLVKKFKRSKVNTILKDSYISSDRTSSTSCLNSTISKLLTIYLKKKTTNFTGLNWTKCENLQIVKYEPGEEFKIHHDYSIKNNRCYTFFVYLNDDYEGGKTYFPILNFSVTPKKGMAVFWKNVTDDNKIDNRLIHAGMPVIKGTKYGCNFWVRC